MAFVKRLFGGALSSYGLWFVVANKMGNNFMVYQQHYGDGLLFVSFISVCFYCVAAFASSLFSCNLSRHCLAKL